MRRLGSRPDVVQTLVHWPAMAQSENRGVRMTTTEYSFTVLFEPAEEGGYVATCPALPGLVTQGETLEEARAMAADAIRGYIESLQKDGLPIPRDTPDRHPIKETVRVSVPAA